jgi:hypothetical protein
LATLSERTLLGEIRFRSASMDAKDGQRVASRDTVETKNKKKQSYILLFIVLYI